MRVLFSGARIGVLVWAGFQLPPGYSYVVYIVAVVWGLTSFLEGIE